MVRKHRFPVVFAMASHCTAFEGSVVVEAGFDRARALVGVAGFAVRDGPPEADIDGGLVAGDDAGLLGLGREGGALDDPEMLRFVRKGATGGVSGGSGVAAGFSGVSTMCNACCIVRERFSLQGEGMVTGRGIETTLPLGDDSTKGG